MAKCLIRKADAQIVIDYLNLSIEGLASLHFPNRKEAGRLRRLQNIRDRLNSELERLRKSGG